MRHLQLRSPSQRLNESVARKLIDVRSMGSAKQYRRFLVVGVARTGSTLLLSLLNAQPRVIAFGEVFRGDGRIGWDMPPFLTRQGASVTQLHAERPIEFLETEVFRRWPREVSAVGFKLFYYHARTGRHAAVWDYLKDQPDLAVIHIKRLNVLEQYLSLRVAHATDVWSSATGAAPAAEPIVLAPEACLRHFEEVRAQEDACDAFFHSHAMHSLTYEDLVADQASALAGVAAHLDVELTPVKPSIRRQRTQPLTEAIANYAELRSYFAGSRWEEFFRQPDTLLAGREAA